MTEPLWMAADGAPGETVICPACSAGVGQRFLIGRADHEYGVDFPLNYWRCTSLACRHVFAAPLPAADDIAKLYANYSTHQPATRSGPLARVLRCLDAAGVRQAVAVPGFERLKCLDYGCGNGSLLTELRRRGMVRLAGFDFDPAARQAAASLGLKLFEREAEALANGPYDLIVMNHVVEHLPAPADAVARLSRCLTTGGRLLLRTPNADSWLARRFGTAWRGWETPRHLHIFTAASLANMAGKYLPPDCRVTALDSSNAMFLGIFHESFHGRFWRTTGAGKLLRHTLSLIAWPSALILRALDRWAGDELRCTIERAR